MRLLDEEVVNRLRKYPLYSQEEKGEEATIIVKFYCPYSKATWLITEAEEQENHDFLLFGYAYISAGEWGYVMLLELEELNKKFTMIEREVYLDDHVTVKQERLRLGI